MRERPDPATRHEQAKRGIVHVSPTDYPFGRIVSKKSSFRIPGTPLAEF